LALFKFPILIPIAILFAIWKRWRFLAGFGASCIAVAIICISVTGIATQRDYASLILSLAGLHNPPVRLATYPIEWNLMPNFHGLLVGLLGGLLTHQCLAKIAMVSSAPAIVWVAYRGRNTNAAGSDLLLLAIPTAILVSHHSYIYDLSPLIIPVLVYLNKFLPRDGHASQFQFKAAAIMFASPVVFCYAYAHFWIVSLAIGAFLWALIENTDFRLRTHNYWPLELAGIPAVARTEAPECAKVQS
jgi:hypothetical protein